MKDIYDQLKEDDLTSDLQIVSDLCGMETVRLLMRNLKGISFYIPKITRLESFITRYIKENPDKTYKQIAFDLGVSEHYLRNIRKKLSGTG